MRDATPAHTIIGQRIVSVIAMAMLLAGCGSGLTGTVSQPQATSTLIPIPPTHTPVALAIHMMNLGGFSARLAIPGPDGLVLYPAGGVSFAGLSSISFFRYSDKRVEQIATAPTEPDGSAGGILGAYYAGDWVSYVTDDSRQAHWVLWIYNVATGQRLQVDSQAREGSSVRWTGWRAGPTDLVWSTFAVSTGSLTMKMLDYTFATGHTRRLASSSTQIFKPMAMSASALLFVETDATADTNTTWLQELGQATPTKIANGGGVNAWMSSRYAAWDDPHTSTISLYDLSTGSLNPTFADCLRPAIADPQPYLVCVQFDTDSWLLVHVPDGASTTFDTGQATLGDGGQIYNGRSFFISPDGNVDYFDLPMQ